MITAIKARPMITNMAFAIDLIKTALLLSRHNAVIKLIAKTKGVMVNPTPGIQGRAPQLKVK